MSKLNEMISAVSRIEGEDKPFDDTVRFLFLRNITIEGIETPLKYHLYADRLRPEIAFGGYGTMVQDILAEDAIAKRLNPHLIVLSLALEELDPAYGTHGWRADGARTELENLFLLLEKSTAATIVVNTFVPPMYPELGIGLSPDGSDIASQVALLNGVVTGFVRERAPRFCLVDWNHHVLLLGSKASLDDRGRYVWKAPFRPSFLNLYAQHLARIVRVLKGKAKKCIIVDCDNTLWGGVVGEEGLDGIELDPNSYPGKAFYDFQTSLLHLAERGILIVVCSKNNEADVLEVLDSHPACQLKRKHLSGWRINWRDKATNIAELADELNLGLDSFVFVDDNPVECDLVKKLLPDVTVLQVPEKLYEFPSILFEQGLFDAFRQTDEDRKRAHLYQSESQRKRARVGFKSVEEYLSSLETVASIHRVRPGEIPRVAQLTQKTNQFNLHPKRYSEHDVATFADRPESAVFVLSVSDCFGNIGLVGVLILECRDGAGRVDSFLMSCRALGRGLERVMIERCLHEMAVIWDVETWHAEYVPTRKNQQVADFWSQNGFIQTNNAADSTRSYMRDAKMPAQKPPPYITIRED